MVYLLQFPKIAGPNVITCVFKCKVKIDFSYSQEIIYESLEKKKQEFVLGLEVALHKNTEFTADLYTYT